MFEAIVVPRGPEERAVARGVARAHSRIRIVTSGIGPRAAALAADGMLRDRAPATALVTGLCGALNPSLVAGDILVYASVADRDGTQVACDAELSARVAALLPGAQTGIRAVCTDAAVTRISEKRALRDIALADAVDMESFAIATRLQRAGVKVAVVRVASDGPGDELPDLDKALDESGGLNVVALLGALFAKPRAAARLTRNGWRALRTLRVAIGRLA